MTMTNSPFNHPVKRKSLLIPTFKTITIVDPEEIVYIKAMQNYCMLYKHDSTRVLSSLPFGKVLEILEFYNFYQCHKSYAVKLDRVVSYCNKADVQLECHMSVPVARRRKKEFVALVKRVFDRSSRKAAVCH